MRRRQKTQESKEKFRRARKDAQAVMCSTVNVERVDVPSRFVSDNQNETSFHNL